jgi:hypothetical protein
MICPPANPGGFSFEGNAMAIYTLDDEYDEEELAACRTEV